MSVHVHAVANVLRYCIKYEKYDRSRSSDIYDQIHAAKECFGKYHYIFALVPKADNFGYERITYPSHGELCERLSKLSLVELREILYLVIPFCHYTIDSHGQSLEKTSAVQSVIKFIEDDLFRMIDEHKNGFDLVNENQQLKNQITTLDTQLADIKKVFNGSS